MSCWYAGKLSGALSDYIISIYLTTLHIFTYRQQEQQTNDTNNKTGTDHSVGEMGELLDHQISQHVRICDDHYWLLEHENPAHRSLCDNGLNT